MNTYMIRRLRRNQGFTMAELIIVIAILAVLIVYLVRNFGVRSDDAKIAMVGNILSKDVPAAFQSFILENNGCLEPAENAANFENFLEENENNFDADYARTGIKLLLDNGVPAGTPWNNAFTEDSEGPSYSVEYTLWSADFTASDLGEGAAFLEVDYPLSGVGNTSRAVELLTNKLRNSSEVHSVNGVTAAGGLVRGDIDEAAAGGGNNLVVRYACS